MAELTSELLPILQLDDVVVLPGMTATLAVESDPQRAALTAAQKGNRLILLVPHVEGKFAAIGTVAQVVESGQLPSGAEVTILKGLHRARLGGGQSDIGGALWVQVEPLPDGDPTDAARERAREYRALIENLLELRGAGRAIEAVRSVRHPGHLADLAGYSPDFSIEQKLEVLETLDIEQRLSRLIGWTKDVLADASVREKVRTEVNEGMEKTQRDFLLRQQLEAIKKQLGEGGDDVTAGYRARLENAGMPDNVRAEVERELDRFERTSEQSPEHGWIRTYLDWMFEIPWNVRSDDNFDLAEARRILDEDHTGLEDVKQRIIEFLAVRKLRSERGITVLGGGSGAIITLVGPPGVGKTSLGESVARALGRKFARISLGGIHDEADIRGHRRTYVGALPGRIVRALKEAGTKNPVIMLDEIDKVGSDWRGDPSSALLEVLDPAQNNTFRDHYLEVDLDLSEVLFIPTANVWETIPAPLLDRMELIRLDGYTENEKVAIARDHLLRRQIEHAGLRPDEVSVTDAAILAVITDHTREAGVRNLERELGKMTRKVATRIAGGELVAPLEITPAQVRELLGKPKFDNEVAERTAVAGVATGLAVTGTGGDVLFIEAANAPGDGKLTLTGQLGDVMKESAQIALSYVRAHAADLGIDPEAARQSIHVHVPAGAVPKDGPSAGVAMTTAIVSLLTGRPMRSSVAMTGEVTLQGLVLPIGGVKQKVLAAHRMGLREVILPGRNEKDIEDVPQSVRDVMTFHLARRVEEALDVALEPVATEAAAAA
jgi:ATP-dependent Lon protease